jgi:hypothetical protein
VIRSLAYAFKALPLRRAHVLTCGIGGAHKMQNNNL